jgi:hypothetical protein
MLESVISKTWIRLYWFVFNTLVSFKKHK